MSSGADCLCGSFGANNQELFDDATDLPVCDYDQNPTPLYKALEQNQWGAVSKFLKTGTWPGSFFSDSKPPRLQARTWIHRFDDSGHEIDDNDYHPHKNFPLKPSSGRSLAATVATTNGGGGGGRHLRWRQLPLHAALIFMAPPLIIKQLIEAFPYALRCPDDKGMLPLHLAFRQAVPDDILTILLRLFPNGMHVRDQKGRLPVECVRNDTNLAGTGLPPVRGMIIQSIMQQSKEKFSQEQQHTIESFQKDISELQKKLQMLEMHVEAMNDRESRTREELAATVEQLHIIRKNHKRLQDLQRLTLQRQSEQEILEKRSMSFQQRVMEQLDLQDEQHHHHRASSRGRSGTRRDRLDAPREPAPISPRGGTPLPQADSRHLSPAFTSNNHRASPIQRRANESSYEEEDETPSYTSLNSRLSDFTKSVFPNAFNTYSGATAPAFTSNTIKPRDRHDNNQAIFKNRSYATKATAVSGTTMNTRGQLLEHTDDEQSHHHDQKRVFPLHSQHSIFDRHAAPRGIARAIYPIKVEYESSTDQEAGTTAGNSNRMGTATPTNHGPGATSNNNHGRTPREPLSTTKHSAPINCAGSDAAESLNWNFSFTPGFLKPLSVKEL